MTKPPFGGFYIKRKEEKIEAREVVKLIPKIADIQGFSKNYAVAQLYLLQNLLPEIFYLFSEADQKLIHNELLSLLNDAVKEWRYLDTREQDWEVTLEKSAYEWQIELLEKLFDKFVVTAP